MDKTRFEKYEQFEREVKNLTYRFRKAYNHNDLDEAYKIAQTLDQKLHEEGLDLLKMCKCK
ncbi:MAG: hypothetical protein ABIB79_02810 [archaeon]